MCRRIRLEPNPLVYHEQPGCFPVRISSNGSNNPFARSPYGAYHFVIVREPDSGPCARVRRGDRESHVIGLR